MLKLIPPGKRGNRFWLARGRLAGKVREWSTGTLDKELAERNASEFAARFLKSTAAETTVANRTFQDAAIAYCAFRQSDARAIKEINRLIAELGDRPAEDIRHADLVATADRLYPNHKASSRNKLVISHAAAILHYAAEQEWCKYRKFPRFDESAPETRAVNLVTAKALVAAAEDLTTRAMVVFLFGQAMRVTDVISVQWERVNLKTGVIEVYIAKTDEWRQKALHPETRAALAAMPGDNKETGPVFPYRNRWAVYRALKPVLKAAGVRFTPHMARHSLGKWLNDAGAALRTIMDMLDHKDPRSSIRYQSTDMDGQRRALTSVGKFVGKAEKPKKIKAGP